MALAAHRRFSLGAWITLPLVVLLSWLIFCLDAACEYRDKSNSPMVLLFIALGAAPAVLTWMAMELRRRWWPAMQRRLQEHTDRLSTLPVRSVGLWIGLAAAVGLYLELVLIRYHGTCFAIFGFFKNLSLLSCFLGLGMGYALGRLRLVLTPLVLPLLAIQVITMHFLRYADIATTMQNPISEQLTMGLGNNNGIVHVTMAYAFLVWVFSFNALCLIPLGQLASYLMGRSAKLPAYGWNLAGSIAAVLFFWGLSFLWAPPVIWFAVGFVGLMPFLARTRVFTGFIAALVLGIVGTSFTVDKYDLFSPYQILTVLPVVEGTPMIMVNHFFYQAIVDLSPQGSGLNGKKAFVQTYYGLPYVFQKSPRDVLVVGAGSGNDVASALRHGAEHIDAVEIDPVILQLGRSLHPERPYSSDRVTAHVQDARAFFRFTDKKYDLIVYGLLDSHTAVSGMSGVRLDSYIYTVEAFQRARSCLKDGGVLCLSFALNNDSGLAEKLSLMLSEAFDGQRPRILKSPTSSTTFVIGGDSATAEIPSDVTDLTSYFALTHHPVDASTDDWPFFYMPVRKYPVSYLVMIATMMTMAALFITPIMRMGGGRVEISAPCFLLGAGFMLLETKAVTELALFYGSTWIVISIVILAILVMAFLANLVVMRWRRIPRAVSYILLLASLGLSLWFSTISGSMTSEWLSRFLPTAIITLPLFFSGLIFSAEMDSASSIPAAMGSNLIGAMLGGCLEYNSMYFGYRSLYILAIVIYGLSMISSLTKSKVKRETPVEAVV